MCHPEGDESEVSGKKKGILKFEEGMKNFTCYGGGKGPRYLRMLSVSIYVDDKYIGYMGDDGKVTITGNVIEKEPTTIMYYSTAFILGQWLKIGERAREFAEMCSKREIQFAPAFKKLEDLAQRMFPENESFRHLEITKIGSRHYVLAGGKGQWETCPPGIYMYDDAPYQGEDVKIGYRPVEEHRIEKTVELEDEVLIELVKAANSIDTLKG